MSIFASASVFSMNRWYGPAGSKTTRNASSRMSRRALLRKSADDRAILPVLTGRISRLHAAMFSFRAGVMPPMNACNRGAEEANAAVGLDVAGKKRSLEFIASDDPLNPANAACIPDRLIPRTRSIFWPRRGRRRSSCACAGSQPLSVSAGRQYCGLGAAALGRARPDLVPHSRHPRQAGVELAKLMASEAITPPRSWQMSRPCRSRRPHRRIRRSR